MLADVTVPYGDWISTALTTLQPIATLALTGIASYVMAAYIPPWLRMIAGASAQARVNQIIEKAVSSAIAQTTGAVQGGTVTIPIASSILTKAMQYTVDQAPAIITPAAQDKVENLTKMVLSRMQSAGVRPADFGINEAKAAVKGAKFDFQGTISDALSGKGKS